MNLKQKILTGLALCSGLSAHAAVLTTASFDTYSYAFVGTNSSGNSTINVSQYVAEGHFTFGVVQFDVSGLSTSGDKFLLMRATGFTDGSMGAPTTTSGSYSVNVGIMPLSFTDYLNSPSDSGPPPPGTGKTPWFNTNILPLTPIGTLDFVNQSVVSLDVTSAVNDWINGADNFGFVLWNPSDTGSVLIQSSENAFAPNLNTVPEPETFAMIGGVLALSLAFYRRRKLSHQ